MELAYAGDFFLAGNHILASIRATNTDCPAVQIIGKHKQ